MSQLSYALEEAPFEEPLVSADVPWTDPPPRSIWQPITLIVPVIFATGGYFFSSPILADISFLALTILCSVFLLMEMSRFSERFGLGGIVLFGGVLTWFCYDYFQHWFLAWTIHWSKPIPQSIVAKAAMYHTIYIMCMTIGIRITAGRWLSRLIKKFPELPRPSSYFVIVIITQIIGLSPYVLFTREPFWLSIIHQIEGGRNSQVGVQWTVGRTGNVNFSFGAYVAQMLQVGEGGAILASFCIVFLRQNIIRNIVCGAIWALWLALGFGSGTRGEIILFMLPLMCFLFIRYHVQAQEFLHKYSVRAYIFVGIVLLFSVALVQVQIRYRNSGFQNISLTDVSFSQLEGNSMFSEGLLGYVYIPDRHDYFYNSFPGQMVVEPIPNFLFWAAVAPMPRAIWTTKPIDPSWKWYNAVATGRTTLGGGQIEGTTVSQGIVGYWYFRFGLAGVIEGGLFMGWLLGVFERAAFNNGGRPMAFFAALALLTWIFRTYRDADFQDLADTMVVLVALSISILLIRPFLPSHQIQT